MLKSAHSQDMYGNFTLPKLFIDVSWWFHVVSAKIWLAFDVHWSVGWLAYQTVGTFRRSMLCEGLLDPLVSSMDRPIAVK